MKKEPDKQAPNTKYQATFEIKAIALFTETHCCKECQWLVYGKVNVLPLNNVGICCACREVLNLDIRTDEFFRTAKCKETTKLS